MFRQCDQTCWLNTAKELKEKERTKQGIRTKVFFHSASSHSDMILFLQLAVIDDDLSRFLSTFHTLKSQLELGPSIELDADAETSPKWKKPDLRRRDINSCSRLRLIDWRLFILRAGLVVLAPLRSSTTEYDPQSMINSHQWGWRGGQNSALLLALKQRLDLNLGQKWKEGARWGSAPGTETSDAALVP